MEQPSKPPQTPAWRGLKVEQSFKRQFKVTRWGRGWEHRVPAVPAGPVASEGLPGAPGGERGGQAPFTPKLTNVAPSEATHWPHHRDVAPCPGILK